MRYLVFFILLISIQFAACVTSKKTIEQPQSLASWREAYKASFVEDARSPLKAADLPFLDFYEEDPTWKLTCSCTAIQDAKPFDMPLYSGITRSYKVHSILNCKRLGTDIQLYVYQQATKPANPMYANHLFLPFKDETNDEATYGGGRYIDLQTFDIIDGQVTIDFNQCYNPWCAFSDGYNCPIPPIENHLQLEVRAGEKKFKGTYKEKSKTDK
ncbi:MAG: DUF1684 domain-containing protein [Chitinophagales bacterium]|nr:DUF1684 domain-containing protein [Chitinophagales bacterium]